MRHSQIIVVWPFIEPSTPDHLVALIDFLSAQPVVKPNAPILLINHCVRKWLSGAYKDILYRIEQMNWDVHWVWSVDTCQTWLEGFGYAYQKLTANQIDKLVVEREYRVPLSANCYFFLLPADFHYSTPVGQAALEEIARQIQQFPHTSLNFLLGQLHAEPSEFKEIMDNFVTWKLLELWFPQQSSILRKLTSKPRSEFIGLSDSLLGSMLCQRWFPYEQTLVILIRLVTEGRTNEIGVYDLGTLEEDQPLDRFQEFITQAERMERVLKMCWREIYRNSPLWYKQYSYLSEQSRIIMHSVVEVAENLWSSAEPLRPTCASCDPFTRNRESGGMVAKGRMTGTF